MVDVCVIGSFVQDLAFSTRAFPAAGESRIGTFKTGPGGKGFNQAIVCNRQAVDTAFIGAVGDDLFGRSVRDFIAGEDLEAHLQIHREHASGAASIVVNAKGENLIVVALGANEYLTSEHVQEHAEMIRGARVVVCQVESSVAATRSALEIARATDAISLPNPAPINDQLTRELVSLADILTPNETEFAFLMEHLFRIGLPENYWLADDATLHDYCRRAEVGIVILTLGEKGCFVSHNPDMRRHGGLTTALPYFRVPAAKVDARDTTGAGDAFTGGLAAGLVRYPGDLEQALGFATVLAGLSTERTGTAPVMPRLEAVQAYFSTKPTPLAIQPPR